MPLTKKDLSQIKGIVQSEIENLARIVAKGFESVDKRFQRIDERFEQVDKRFEQVDRRFDRLEDRVVNIDSRLGVIERDVAEIRKHFVYRDEFEDALARIELLEKKAGIKNVK
ncbi:MAG: hypothetical protein HYV52_01410 [Parcubacteria group bacterium]|nr:hypothetical protein [Parcubacteria group bacterium]